MDKILRFSVIMVLFFSAFYTTKLATSGRKKAPKDRLFNSPSGEVPLRKVLPFLTLSLTLAGDGFDTRGVIGQL